MYTEPSCTALHSPDACHVCTAGDSEDELSGFTPSFLWLLRDFYLSLEEDGRKVLLCSHNHAVGLSCQTKCEPVGALFQRAMDKCQLCAGVTRGVSRDSAAACEGGKPIC